MSDENTGKHSLYFREGDGVKMHKTMLITAKSKKSLEKWSYQGILETGLLLTSSAASDQNPT